MRWNLLVVRPSPLSVYSTKSSIMMLLIPFPKDLSKNPANHIESQNWMKFKKHRYRNFLWSTYCWFVSSFETNSTWWSNKYCLFSSLPGEMIQFDYIILFRWVGSTTNQNCIEVFLFAGGFLQIYFHPDAHGPFAPWIRVERCWFGQWKSWSQQS